MLTQHIALVPEGPSVNASELTRVSAALQKQVTRDLGPVWGVAATVDAFPHLEDVPIGYWPVVVTARALGARGGVHLDRNGQPYAEVELGPSWSLAASRACLEMLVDPFGSRLVAGASPRADQGRVEFLAGVCGPSGHAQYAYTINDMLVSDFCTPAYLEPIHSSGERYSFTGAIEWPHQVLPGGYLCWFDPISDSWWLRHHFGDAAIDESLGQLDRQGGSIREAIYLHTPSRNQATKLSVEAFEARMGVKRQLALYASQAQAYRLRTSLETTLSRAVLGARSEGSGPAALLPARAPKAAGHEEPAGAQIEDEIEAAIQVLRARRSLSTKPMQAPAAAPTVTPKPDDEGEEVSLAEAGLPPSAPVATVHHGPPPLPAVPSTAPAVLDAATRTHVSATGAAIAADRRRRLGSLAAAAGVSVLAIGLILYESGAPRSTTSSASSAPPSLVPTQVVTPAAPAASVAALLPKPSNSAPQPEPRASVQIPVQPLAQVQPVVPATVDRMRAAAATPQGTPRVAKGSAVAAGRGESGRASESGADSVDNLIHDRM